MTGSIDLCFLVWSFEAPLWRSAARLGLHWRLVGAPINMAFTYKLCAEHTVCTVSVQSVCVCDWCAVTNACAECRCFSSLCEGDHCSNSKFLATSEDTGYEPWLYA